MCVLIIINNDIGDYHMTMVNTSISFQGKYSTDRVFCPLNNRHIYLNSKVCLKYLKIAFLNSTITESTNYNISLTININVEKSHNSSKFLVEKNECWPLLINNSS